MSDELWCEHVGMQRIAALLEAWLWLDGSKR
jgi:hypothetical protein